MSVEFIQHWWLTFFIIFALVMYFFAFASYRVQEDARKRGLGRAAVTFWSISVVFFGPIFLPLYLVFRTRAVFARGARSADDRDRYSLCPHCGEENPIDEKVCKRCHRLLGVLASTLGRKLCPYCGAENPVEANRCKGCDQVIGFADTDEE